MGKGQGHLVGWVDRFRQLINYGTGAHVHACADEIAQSLRTHGKNMVISLEGFTNPFVDTHYLYPKDVYLKAEHIFTALEPAIREGLELRILVTVRDQADLLPSLFAQVGFQGAMAGLFEFDYDRFLDFMFEDRVAGFGPDFAFDRYAEHCAAIFGREAVTVLNMADLITKRTPDAIGALAKIIPMSTGEIAQALDKPAKNVRRVQGSTRYKMMVGSPVALHRLAGSRDIGWIDKARIMAGRPVFRTLPDRNARIAAYYQKANARLAAEFGVAF